LIYVTSLRVAFVLAEPINSLIDGIYVKPTGVPSGVILFLFFSFILLAIFPLDDLFLGFFSKLFYFSGRNDTQPTSGELNR
jgi:hypothetical protein